MRNWKAAKIKIATRYKRKIRFWWTRACYGDYHKLYILTWIRPNNNQIRWCKYAKVWALSERCDRVTHSRAPLDSTVIYPKPGLTHTTWDRQKGKPIKIIPLPWAFQLDSMYTILPFSICNAFLDSSSFHEHEDGKLQAWDLLEMAHLELALLHPYLRLIHLDATLCTCLDQPSSSFFLHDSNGHKALGHFFIFQLWDQHMAQAMPMDKPTSETQFTH